ncbi:MAG: hypothetical protein PHF37_05280 [Phycisphaerae bacterium]|nr:hypothetical protein [Phycisphaerae bacterium]
MKTLFTICLIFIFCMTFSCEAVTDGFDDGNSNGWTNATGAGWCKWHVVSGRMQVSPGGDACYRINTYSSTAPSGTPYTVSGYVRLVNNTNAAAAIVFWYKDSDNFAQLEWAGFLGKVGRVVVKAGGNTYVSSNVYVNLSQNVNYYFWASVNTSAQTISSSINGTTITSNYHPGVSWYSSYRYVGVFAYNNTVAFDSITFPGGLESTNKYTEFRNKLARTLGFQSDHLQDGYYGGNYIQVYADGGLPSGGDGKDVQYEAYGSITQLYGYRVNACGQGETMLDNAVSSALFMNNFYDSDPYSGSYQFFVSESYRDGTKKYSPLVPPNISYQSCVFRAAFDIYSEGGDNTFKNIVLNAGRAINKFKDGSRAYYTDWDVPSNTPRARKRVYQIADMIYNLAPIVGTSLYSQITYGQPSECKVTLSQLGAAASWLRSYCIDWSVSPYAYVHYVNPDGSITSNTDGNYKQVFTQADVALANVALYRNLGGTTYRDKAVEAVNFMNNVCYDSTYGGYELFKTRNGSRDESSEDPAQWSSRKESTMNLQALTALYSVYNITGTTSYKTTGDAVLTTIMSSEKHMWNDKFLHGAGWHLFMKRNFDEIINEFIECSHMSWAVDLEAELP